jgi:hypothetical protein
VAEHPCPEVETLTIRNPTRLQRRGGRKLIVTPEGAAAPPRKPRRDDTVVKALVRAHRWRRRPARPASVRTWSQDRGDMTLNRASPHHKPAAGTRRRRQPDATLVRSILRPGPPIAPTSTGAGASDRALRHACRDRSANPAVAPRHQTGPLCRPRNARRYGRVHAMNVR